MGNTNRIFDFPFRETLNFQAATHLVTCSYTSETIFRAFSSDRASATMRMIGSVFEPRTRNQPSGIMTLTPSRASIGKLEYSCRNILRTPGMRCDEHSIFSLTML